MKIVIRLPTLLVVVDRGHVRSACAILELKVKLFTFRVNIVWLARQRFAVLVVFGDTSVFGVVIFATAGAVFVATGLGRQAQLARRLH